MAKKNKSVLKWILLIFGSIFSLGILTALFGYFIFFNKNVKEDYTLYLSENATSEEMLQQLEEDDVLSSAFSLKTASKILRFDKKINPGRYELAAHTNNLLLLKKVGSGKQDPVKFRFQNLRLKTNFAGLLGRSFEADSLDFIQLLSDSATAQKYGFTEDNFYTMFIPNTYHIYWNTKPEKIIGRFHDEYNTFWNESRKKKAEQLGFTQQEVSILASIVQGEVIHNDEMNRVAGLYINRLNRNMFLQADPTVIFAVNDFTIRRVLKKHLLTNSPYNTYINKGLPPGPVNMPSIDAIDAVLNPEKHDYIYMVAKEDLSGYHNFNADYENHLKDARKYQKELDKRNIN